MKRKQILPRVDNIVDLSVPEEYRGLEISEEETDEVAAFLVSKYQNRR